MNLPVASCIVCGQEKELAVWVDPAVTGGSFHGVCFQCRQAAQQSFALDGVHAERTMSVSCPHCNRQVEIVLLVSPRK